MEPAGRTIWQRIANDFKRKELIGVKLLCLVHSSTSSVIYPYLTVFMQDLGINTEEIGILSFLISLIGFFLAPLTGIVADRIGNFKKLVVALMLAGAFTSFSFLLIPPARTIIPYPSEMMVSVTCVEDGVFYFSLNENERCFKSPSTQRRKRVNGHADCTERKLTSRKDTRVTLQSCGLMCTDSSKPVDLGQTQRYTVEWFDVDGINLSRRFGNDPPILMWVTKGGTTKYFNSTLPASTSYFFPTGSIPRFSCDNYTCFIENLAGNELQKTAYDGSIFFPELTSNVNGDDSVIGFSYAAKNESDDLRCNWQTMDEKFFFTVHLDDDESAEPVTFDLCKPECIANMERADFCNETMIMRDLNVRSSVSMTMIVRVALAVISGTAAAMTDSAIITILRSEEADYGMQYVYAYIGGMITGQVSGFLIDALSTESYKNYSGLFYFYSILKTVSAIIMWNIDLDVKTPAKRVLNDVRAILSNIEVMGLLFICLMYGIFLGALETYLFPFLRSLNASGGLLGTTILVGKLSGMPFVFLSGPILEHFGHANVLVFGLVVYSIRFTGYSLIGEAWQCLFLEVLESICMSLGFTTLVTYGAKLSTMKTDTTIQGLIGGLYYAVGKGLGGLVSGYIIKAVCYRYMFQTFAVITMIFSIAYYSFNRWCIVDDDVEQNRRKNVVIASNSFQMKQINHRRAQGKVNAAYRPDKGVVNIKIENNRDKSFTRK